VIVGIFFSTLLNGAFMIVFRNDVEAHAYECSLIHRVSDAFNALHVTAFEVFFLLKISSVRVGMKAGFAERSSRIAVVLGITVRAVQNAFQKIKFFDVFQNQICLPETNWYLSSVAVVLDAYICINCLILFHFQLREVILNEKKRSSISSVESSIGRPYVSGKMERVVRTNWRIGGTILLCNLFSYNSTVLSFTLPQDLAVFVSVIVNNIVLLVMCFVLTYFTRGVWQVKPGLMLEKFMNNLPTLPLADPRRTSGSLSSVREPNAPRMALSPEFPVSPRVKTVSL